MAAPLNKRQRLIAYADEPAVLPLWELRFRGRAAILRGHHASQRQRTAKSQRPRVTNVEKRSAA